MLGAAQTCTYTRTRKRVHMQNSMYHSICRESEGKKKETVVLDVHLAFVHCKAGSLAKVAGDDSWTIFSYSEGQTEKPRPMDECTRGAG